MRVALLDPTDQPDGLADALAQAGDEVTVVSGHPLPRAFTDRRGYEERLGTVPALVASLVRGGFDVAHAFHPASAWGAVLARRLGGPPVLFSLASPPTREWLVARRYRLAIAVKAAAEADACSVQSDDAAQAFRRYLLREPAVVAEPESYRELYRQIKRG
jgi:hypothetical protein